jgi:septal ring factor EnvC (AmiA/AmiB activator)
MRWWLLVLAFCSVAAAAQGDLEQKRRELERLRQSIETTKRRIDELSGRESTTKRSLSQAQRERHRIAVFVAELERGLRALQDTAAVVEQQIARTRTSLEAAQEGYARVTQAVIEYRARHAGIPQASLRTDEMYRRLTTSLAAYRRTMLQLNDSLQRQQSVLQDVATTTSQVLRTKEAEKQRLQQSIAKGRKEIDAIRADRQKLTQELQAKQQSVAKMRSLISQLVAREEAKRKAEARRRKAEKEQRAAAKRESGSVSRGSANEEEEILPGPKPSGGFAANSLPWPTSQRQLLHGYGSYVSPETNITFDNPGIDIRARVGTPVVAVADGDVSNVSWLPGFGSLVIVDHRNGFRSVYANLSGVSVTQGATVRAGSRIGNSGESVDGAFVHFELWRGRERQNPLTYLR